jgi:hypothetical protein
MRTQGLTRLIPKHTIVQDPESVSSASDRHKLSPWGTPDISSHVLQTFSRSFKEYIFCIITVISMMFFNLRTHVPVQHGCLCRNCNTMESLEQTRTLLQRPFEPHHPLLKLSEQKLATAWNGASWCFGYTNSHVLLKWGPPIYYK